MAPLATIEAPLGSLASPSAAMTLPSPDCALAIAAPDAKVVAARSSALVAVFPTPRAEA